MKRNAAGAGNTGMAESTATAGTVVMSEDVG